MSLIIIFPDQVGISIVNPAADCPLPIEAIARKDVPAGLPYRIVSKDFFNNQIESPREEWTADFSKPDGHGDTRYGAGTDFEVIGYGSDEDENLIFELKSVIDSSITFVKA